MAERARRGKERYAGRPRVEEVPSEALGCPQCKAHYPFGYDCPDCWFTVFSDRRDFLLRMPGILD